jgi:hypothetical protein
MKKSQNMLVWLCKMVLTQHFFHCFVRLVKGPALPNTCQKECNKYDLTAALCFSLAIKMIVPSGLL